jgi:hypothetical protein
MNITGPALKRLQVLYSQYERHSLDAPGSSREARIAWASERAGRKLASFKDLTIDEGRKLIDTLQGLLNVKAPNRTPRKRMNRRDAMNAGTAGRRGHASKEIVLITAADLERIQQQLTRLGWDQALFQRWLLGARGPLKGRDQLRTLGDANRVYWALKNIPARKEKIAS